MAGDIFRVTSLIAALEDGGDTIQQGLELLTSGLDRMSEEI